MTALHWCRKYITNFSASLGMSQAGNSVSSRYRPDIIRNQCKTLCSEQKCGGVVPELLPHGETAQAETLSVL